LIALVPYLPESEREIALSDALAATRAIVDEVNRACILTELVPHLAETLLPEALDVARGIHYGAFRAEILIALAPHLPETLLRDALAVARDIDDYAVRADVLTVLAPHLPETLLPDALAVARDIDDEADRAAVWIALAPYLPEALLSDVIAATRAISEESIRAYALAAFAPHLPDALLLDVLAATREISVDYYRAIALAALPPHPPEAERETAMRDTLAAARAISDNHARARALVKLAPHLPVSERAMALQDALGADPAIVGNWKHIYVRGLGYAALASARELPGIKEYIKWKNPEIYIQTYKVLKDIERSAYGEKPNTIELIANPEYLLGNMNDVDTELAELIDFVRDTPVELRPALRRILVNFRTMESITDRGDDLVKSKAPSLTQPNRENGDPKLSPTQVAAVIRDSTLGRLLRRYEEMLLTIGLPADGFETKQQAQAAARLATTYRSLRQRQIELGLEPLPKDSRVREAERLRVAFDRKAQKTQPTRNTAPPRSRRAKAATLK
jgi:hypothetical protein